MPHASSASPDADPRGLRLVRLAGAAILVLFVAMTVIGPAAPLVETPAGFRTPLVALELAGTPEDVLDVVGPPNHPGRPAAVAATRLSTQVDFLFLLAYAAFYVGIARLLAARGTMAPRQASAVIALAAVTAIADALENATMLRLLDTDPAAMPPALRWLRVFTLLKWNALFAASAAVAAPMWRAGVGWRAGAVLFALGAVCGFAWVLHLPATEWSMVPLALAWTTTWAWALGRRTERRAA